MIGPPEQSAPPIEPPATTEISVPPRPLRRASAQHLALAWLVFFLLGTFAIVTRSSAAIMDYRGMLLPCFLAAVYALVGLRMPNRNTAKFADSIYFMGFLWTLIALIDAVIIQDLTQQVVFRAFGYALFTTGLGMFLRVLILQFHETVPDQVEEAQDSVDKRMTLLLAELDSATARVARFGRTTDRALADELNGVVETIQTLRITIEKGAHEPAALSLAALTESIAAVKAEVTGFRLEHEGVAAGIDGLERSLTGGAAAIESAATGLVAGLQGLPAQVSSAIGRGFDLGLGDATRALGLQARQFEEALGRYAVALTALDRAPTELTRVTRALDDLHQLIRTMESAVAEVNVVRLAELTKTIDDLQSMAEDARAANHEMRDGFLEVLTFLREHAGRPRPQ